MAAGNEIEEIDMTEVLEHLNDIERMTSKQHEEVDRDAHKCLSELVDAGFFAGLPKQLATDYE